MITRGELIDAIDSAERAGLVPFTFVVPVSEQILEAADVSKHEVDRFLRVALERALRELVQR